MVVVLQNGSVQWKCTEWKHAMEEVVMELHNG